jgi:hypothetical protein
MPRIWSFAIWRPRFAQDHNRRLGVFLLFKENGLLGNDDMHAGAFHLFKRFDRALEFALQRAPPVHFLDEIGHAEIGFVEYFIADAV